MDDFPSEVAISQFPPSAVFFPSEYVFIGMETDGLEDAVGVGIPLGSAKV